MPCRFSYKNPKLSVFALNPRSPRNPRLKSFDTGIISGMLLPMSALVIRGAATRSQMNMHRQPSLGLLDMMNPLFLGPWRFAIRSAPGAIGTYRELPGL